MSCHNSEPFEIHTSIGVIRCREKTQKTEPRTIKVKFGKITVTIWERIFSGRCLFMRYNRYSTSGAIRIKRCFGAIHTLWHPFVRVFLKGRVLNTGLVKTKDCGRIRLVRTEASVRQSRRLFLSAGSAGSAWSLRRGRCEVRIACWWFVSCATHSNLSDGSFGGSASGRLRRKQGGFLR